MLSPCHPEMGTKATPLGLYPTFLMKLEVSLIISLKRSSLHYRAHNRPQFDGDLHGAPYLSSVHLIDGNDELLDTQGESKQSVLSGLTVLGDAGLELTGTSGNDENSTVSLRGTGDHVLDEVTVSWGIDDLEDLINVWLPIPDQSKKKLTVTMYLGVSNFQRAISIVIPRSRSALSLSKTQAEIGGTVSVPRSYQLDVKITLTVLEGAFSKFSGFLLELFNGTLVDTTTLVDQVTGGSRFSGVDVTNDYERDQLGTENEGRSVPTDDINVNLILTHGGCL